ncbi:MAG: AMP-binding protein [Candidatus Thermoplasmatota archaeon]
MKYGLLTLAKIPFLYISDIDRLFEDEEKIEKYRQKCLKKILRYATKVPLYREKYKGIDINSINLENISALPILKKDDIRKNFDKIIPYKSKKYSIVSTSGSTGKPVSIYVDFYTIIKALMGFLREIKEYDINWMKDRMSVIVDLTSGSAEEAYLKKTAIPNLKPIFSMNNLQILHVGEDVEKMAEKIEKFNPKFIGGYPGNLRALAITKRKKGLKIEPEVMASSGAVLDEYTKKYIEETFNARVYDVYGSTEAGPIAYECKRGNYHLHYDMVHVEVVDENDNPTDKTGRIVVTKLYGNATPIIRYDGLNDFITPIKNKCGCGINSPIIERIEGRKADSIILPSGKIIPPFTITGIPAKVMYSLQRFSIEQFQIIQDSEDEIIVNLVIDKNENMKEILKEKIREEFEKKIKESKVIIREVDEIEKNKPVVISRLA